MESINHSRAQQLTAPNPFSLVTSCGKGGKTNLAAISWWTYCSNSPATLAVCLSKKGHSGTLIKETGEFGLCIVGESLKESAFKCGTCSGRSVDKATEFGIELVGALKIAPQLVKNSRVAFECRVIEVISVSDHDMFIAEIVAEQADESASALYAIKGYGGLSAVELR